VLGSYDPNDKQVFVKKGQVNTSIIDKNAELFYTIRFQNTGNYRADFVKVVDTLSNMLDLTTLRIVAASHTFDLTIKNKNILIFDFKAIALPDSNTNEQGSHGYISFAIKPQNALANADVIKNKAFIFFDFNPAIITNTTETKNTLTEIASPPSVFRALSVFPNPSSGVLSFRLAEIGQDMKIEIFTSDGRLVISSNQIVQPQNDLNLSFLTDGLYILRINVGKTNWVSRFSFEK
jgi:uncharacterized repeat protein (TIGR01451 family)